MSLSPSVGYDEERMIDIDINKLQYYFAHSFHTPQRTFDKRQADALFLIHVGVSLCVGFFSAAALFSTLLFYYYYPSNAYCYDDEVRQRRRGRFVFFSIFLHTYVRDFILTLLISRCIVMGVLRAGIVVGIHRVVVCS